MRDFVDDNRRISDSNEAIENSVILSNEDESRSSPAASSSTPPTFINTTTTNSSTTIPSPIPFVARPRGSRATTSNDPTLYAICQLCQNKIMSSRLSNLTNHVRRHASLKQFQCVYCIYTHNEMAKVRFRFLLQSTYTTLLNRLSIRISIIFWIIVKECQKLAFFGIFFPEIFRKFKFV